ncbi:leucine-rich repeat-containing protein kinase family protein [Shewanella xiamenensis]|uniref:protein kinase n=1 Tax=Shewanella xiamenensis TaxID=332186 RepID=UPI001C4FE047|nr:protein kinase [Shewanella xiamenensis]
MQTLTQLKAGQLQGVTRLQLVENLTEFPQEIFDLADTLEILDLSNNQLSSLPDDLYRLIHLKILFASNNRFEVLPEVLGQCPKLEMIGFKANQIRVVPEASLPPQTRWLILTDNQITALPERMGQLHRLQKLALAGNRLTSLPASMAQCHNLELVRLSANQLQALPSWVLKLPKLTWLAFAGNPFSHTLVDPHADVASMPNVTLADIELGEKLGEGASGIIYQGRWFNPAMVAATGCEHIAVKLFKGEVTSDGYPADELDCCLTTGAHPNLIKVLAHISQQDQLGLVMELIPQGFSNLGLPPSLASCTRDTFKAGTEFSLKGITEIALQLADTLAHMHGKQVSHGDVYAHNMMVNQQMALLFGDFGAASNLAKLPTSERDAMQAIEVRALGCLLDDLLPFADNDEDDALRVQLRQLKAHCMQPELSCRPRFSDIVKTLAALR